MKKIYLALMCMASLTIVTACGGGNANKGGEAAESEGSAVEVAAEDAPESVTRTRWVYGDENLMYRLTITVEDQALLYFDLEEGGGQHGEYNGPCTYSNGEGSIPLVDSDGQSVGTATFKVNGKTMEFTFQGKTMTMKQKAI